MTLWRRERHAFIHSLNEMKELIAAIGTGNVGIQLDSWPLSILDLQTGVLRKMQQVPDTWQKRIGPTEWQESFWRAMKLDAMVNSRDMTDVSARVRSPRGFDLLINSPFGKPLRRLVGIEILEASQEALSVIRTSNFCVQSPQSAVEQLERSRSTWSLAGVYWKAAS